MTTSYETPKNCKVCGRVMLIDPVSGERECSYSIGGTHEEDDATCKECGCGYGDHYLICSKSER
jgi:hypothetical protein